MPTAPPPRFFRLLLIEDNVGRVQDFRAWLPPWARLVWAQSAGQALGLIRRDRGHVEVVVGEPVHGAAHTLGRGGTHGLGGEHGLELQVRAVAGVHRANAMNCSFKVQRYQIGIAVRSVDSGRSVSLRQSTAPSPIPSPSLSKTPKPRVALRLGVALFLISAG